MKGCAARRSDSEGTATPTAIGFVGSAWSGLLANFAAGIILMILQPFSSNDHDWQVYFDTNRVIRESFGEAGFPAPEQRIAVRQRA